VEAHPEMYMTDDSLELYYTVEDSYSDSVGMSSVESGARPWRASFEPLPALAETPVRSSIESPPELELKPLPNSLKYAYLGARETLSVIISSQLTEEQKRRLIDILREHRATIGWG
jgi:hypothetical protein